MEQNRKILIIEDHEIIVWALRTHVDETFSNVSSFWAPTFELGLELLEEHKMSLIILDVDVPGGNSPKMISWLRKIQPAVRILVHTAMDEQSYALKYLSAGADGFLSKKSPLETLSQALILTLNGKKYISPLIQEVIAEKFLNHSADIKAVEFDSLFTKREQQIMKLLLQGKWTKEIAGQLGIQLNTVSTHKLSIFEKLDVDNIIELYKKVQVEMPELLH
jgi:two-component system invasion response regulator UvrY